MAVLICRIGFVSPAARQQDDFWRVFSEWEARRDALNRVAEAQARSSRYRRPVVTTPHLRDIKRIQALNLELKQTVSQRSALDFKFLAKSAAEINKRGKRFQVSLGVRKPKERDRKNLEATPDELRALLTALRSSITGFVDNPVFKNARVVDVKLLIKAGGDLEDVIELSDWVEKSCKKLVSSAGMH